MNGWRRCTGNIGRRTIGARYCRTGQDERADDANPNKRASKQRSGHVIDYRETIDLSQDNAVSYVLFWVPSSMKITGIQALPLP